MKIPAGRYPLNVTTKEVAKIVCLAIFGAALLFACGCASPTAPIDQTCSGGAENTILINLQTGKTSCK